MNELVKVYNDGTVELQVEFKIIDGAVYANANSMADSKKLENWKASTNTIRYIEALKNKDSLDSMELIISKRGGVDIGGGTWIHHSLINNLKEYINNHNPKKNSDLLYLLKANNYYKIGIASDVINRIGQLQTGCMFKIELIDCWTINNPYKLEIKLHTLFSNKRMIGEWFNLNDEDIKYIMETIAKLSEVGIDDVIEKYNYFKTNNINELM